MHRNEYEKMENKNIFEIKGVTIEAIDEDESRDATTDVKLKSTSKRRCHFRFFHVPNDDHFWRLGVLIISTRLFE